jgi:hypothetical protein
VSQVHTPDVIPVTPEGFTKHMQMHMNFGKGQGGATYTIKDKEGRLMPFGYQYDTRKGGLTGFTLSTRDGVMTWAELVAYWPDYLKKKSEGGAA